MYSFELECPGLDVFARSELLRCRLAEYNKSLEPAASRALLRSDNGCGANPLWLSLACEEVRVVGSIEEVGACVAKLAACAATGTGTSAGAAGAGMYRLGGLVVELADNMVR